MNSNTTTLNALDRGLEVDPQAKDRAISARVMKTISEPSTEEPSGWQGVAGDENDNPSSWVRMQRSIRRKTEGRNMAIYI